MLRARHSFTLLVLGALAATSAAATGLAGPEPARPGPAPAIPCERGYLGMQIAGDPRSDTVLVKSVLRDGPAWRGGLRAGDRLVSVGDRHMRGAASVEGDFEGLEAGRTIEVVLERDGVHYRARVRLGRRAEVSGQALLVGSAAPRAAPRPAPRDELLRTPQQPGPVFWTGGDVPGHELARELRRHVEEYDRILADHRRHLAELLERHAARAPLRGPAPAPEPRDPLEEARRRLERRLLELERQLGELERRGLRRDPD